MLRRTLPIAALLAAPAAAQDQADIVVQGRGLPASPGERAFDIFTIDRARLQANASQRLESVLADVAGLQQFRRSDSRSANPTSQGITLRGIGGNASSRALLVLDGVPQADPFGGWVAFPAYATGRLGQVRVTRGGGSGYFGPGALAGTVELTSADPDQLAPSTAASPMAAARPSMRKGRPRSSAMPVPPLCPPPTPAATASHRRWQASAAPSIAPPPTNRRLAHCAPS